MTPATVRVPIGKVDGRITRWREDILAVEEPLEIRVGSRSLSVTMRTPGHDFELAAGFLFAEDIINSASQIRKITNSAPNIVGVELSTNTVIEAPTSQRSFMMTSACGLCGKKSLESLAANRCPVLPLSDLSLDAGVIHRLPHQLRQRQDIFESTGGLHAAALFNYKGELTSLREDVGRHNAVDKLVGHALLSFRTPLRDSVMLVSGRASFELVQKASMAGVPLLAAVGAPSSLAVATAERCGMTLIGFLRNGSFNVYTGTGCIAGLEKPQ
jgi:FdhD protein